MSCAHEYKNCPRCQVPFQCRVGNISSCQCTAIVLTADERGYIQQYYDDCLCAHCMSEMKTEYINKTFSLKIKSIIGAGH